MTILKCTSNFNHLLDMKDAKIEVDFQYQNCCNDDDGKAQDNLHIKFFWVELYFLEGLSPVNSSRLEESTCSKRTCHFSSSISHAVWMSEKVNVNKMQRFDQIYLSF